MLVVFEDHVIIFSDKDCVFPASGDIDKDWSRWYRRAVAKSASQLYGAERIIRSREPLYLDANLHTPFPLPLPDPSRMKVHRILVAHGASARCRDALGGNGTLMIRPDIVNGQHELARAEGGTPFAIGRINATKGYIHVLDDAALVLLLRALDTAADLIGYLSKKEAFITSGKLGMAAGEEALLGYYLTNLNEHDEHDFIPAEHGAVLGLDESSWHHFATSPAAARQQVADEVSYLWDSLIEKFVKHFREGTSHFLSDPSTASQADLLRFFAREHRVRRRMLSKQLVDAVRTTPATRVRHRFILPSRPGDPHWVFVLFPLLNGVTDAEYRRTRRGYLHACCMVMKLMNPSAVDVVGFATESGRPGSEDAEYLDAREWTQEMQDTARRLQRDFQIHVNVTRIESTEYEYPPATSSVASN